ncbi:MAG: hypothetical protein ACLSHJ_01285 [Oscillospiraceae bacterium]
MFTTRVTAFETRAVARLVRMGRSCVIAVTVSAMSAAQTRKSSSRRFSRPVMPRRI